MNQTQTRSLRKKVLSLILAVVMVVSLLPISAFASGDSTSTTAATSDGYEYNIMFLDCGRKYYSVDSIKKIIDNASAAGFNYIQLAVGNDGLRFLLDDMSLTVGNNTYDSDAVKEAIHNGNTTYNETFDDKKTEDTKTVRRYNPDTNELTQGEMDTVIAYANSKGMGVIPCVNTPGHMDAILSAATSLTCTTCSYGGSARTIDVTNTTAVAFTQALLQKYIAYFAGKGCQLFNMGADEYANDIYTSGSMGFGNLQSSGKYNYYVEYVNQLAQMIKAAGMKPMAFNDGIYFNNVTDCDTFDTDIIICYWSSGWTGYTPMPASKLAGKGFKLINTNGDYYWVLGKTAKCSAAKAGGFDKTAFPGGTVNNPVGSMFCIWADFPGAEEETDVISKTAGTIAAFGNALPKVPFAIKNAAGETSAKMTVDAQMKLSVNAEATWSVTAGSDVVRIAALTRSEGVTGTSVTIEALKTGSAEITATNEKGDTATFAVTVDEPKTKTITVAVGDTVKINVPGEFSGTLDNEVAQVTTQINPAEVKDKKEVKSTVELESGKQYLIFNNREKALLTSTASNDWNQAYYGLKLNGTVSADNETDLWTISGSNGSYTVKNTAGNYLTIGENTASVEKNSATLTLAYNTSGNESYWNISENSYYLNHLGDSTTAGGYADDSAATDAGSKWAIYKITGGDASTDITFTGVTEGTTSVTIGGVKYNIKVVSADLAKVTPLTIEYWITNRQVTADGATSKTINATDSTIYSEAGAKLSDLVPAEGTGMETNANTVFWKGTRLTSDGKQNTDKGNDKTTSGNDFAYIRYWEGKWAFSADGTKWIAFDENDQVVAYYLQKTTVTDEVETQVVDWGEKRETYGYATWVLLDYAVKYESGDRTPDSFPVTNKTLAFHCSTGSEDLGKTVIQDGSTYYRKIGAIRAEESDDYEVYMITVTPTSDTKTEQISATGSANTAKSYKYEGTEKVVWVDDATNLGDFADKNLQYEGFHVGGNATVPGLKIYSKQGMLVTYYVRAKKTTDSLHVHYIDRTANDFEFYNYNIVVNSATIFDPDISLNPKNPNDVLYKGTVTNSLNKKQTVSANLSAMPQIGAQYRFSDYECVEVRRGDDGKDVYLYYTFTNSKTFVVDFGLPLEIAPADMNSDLQGKVEKVSVGNAATLRYGTVDVKDSSADGYKVVYNLNKPIDNNETINLTYSGTNVTTNEKGAVTWNANIIPATSVYYEDSFATFTNADSSTGVDKGTGYGYWVTDPAGTADSNATQALEELGNKQNVYGYDPAYQRCSKFSMGSATKVTVDADTSSIGQSPTATFTFKGTGFDVISLTDNTSGAISVKVYSVANDGTEKLERGTIVNNYYGYTYDGTKWTVASSDTSNALYQIPVIKISGLDYGTYKAVITVSYATYADMANKGAYNFWLDAIRVYDPMGKNNDTYKDDGEGYPQYIKLRSELIKTLDQDKTTMVFIDGANEADIATYANYGPNNEVYLTTGQAISFTVAENAAIATIQIGAKAPSGTAKMTVKDKNDVVVEKEISTATEMYYQLTVNPGDLVTISNTGGNILSLTNVKVTYKANPTGTASLAALTTEDQENAVAQVRALFAAPVQEPFNPDRFDVSWSRNVRKGDTAKLTVKTSEDVEAITVNGETIDSYVERNERTGWGWWAKTVTYREFTYTTTADVTKDFTVCAVNAAGVSSEAKTATLTVRPSVRDWLHGIIGKWF